MQGAQITARRTSKAEPCPVSDDKRSRGQGIILGQLCNTLEPRLAMYFSSACTELRALLPPAVRQQLKACTLNVQPTN